MRERERERVIVRSTREKNQKPRNHPSEQAPSVFGVRVSAVKSNQHQVNVYLQANKIPLLGEQRKRPLCLIPSS